MGINSIEENVEKYLWLHRLQVSLFLYLIMYFISTLLDISQIKLLYIPLIIYYLIFPKKFDTFIPFKKRFYKITLTIAVAVVLIIPRFPISEPWVLNFFGLTRILVLLFIVVNSLFILVKVFKVSLKEMLHEKIWK